MLCRLLERVGHGAFGVVWRARQRAVDREVAVKIARSAVANDPTFIRRFEVDAQRIARIEHPHVVPLYDFWRDPDGAYLVMRFMQGGSMRDLLERSELPTGAVRLRMALQITEALAAAHELGVIHGDITSSNVLLDEHANAYLTDFGITGSATVVEPSLTADAPARSGATWAITWRPWGPGTGGWTSGGSP